MGWIFWKHATHHFRLAQDDDILVPFLEVAERTGILPSILRLKVTRHIQLRVFQMTINRLTVVVDANGMFVDVLVFTSPREVREVLEKVDDFV